MALPNVSIEVRRQGLGQVAFTNDGIMGLILPTADTTLVQELWDGVAIHGLAQAEALGIVPDNPDTAAAWKQLSEFYSEAGNGAKLWIILSDEAAMSSNVSGTTNPARTLLNAARGEIAVLGIVRGTNNYGLTVDGLDEDVWSTLANGQQLAEEYQELIMPFSLLVDGLGFSGNADSVRDLKEMTHHRCSVVLAASAADGVASVGQYLGRLAAIPVQRRASRVRDGALMNLEGYLTDYEKVDGRVGALNTLHDKGYIVYRTFPGKSGYYFSGDPTATPATDDLNTISRNRIIDKVLRIAYDVYSLELDDDVPITAEGNIEPAVCAALEEKIARQVRGNMVDEISAFTPFIDPNQNILSGAPLRVVLDITPKGYLNPIRVSIGFTNPFAT